MPITLFSPMGRDMLGFGLPAPFGLRDEVFALVLPLPVVFLRGLIFFDGAFRAPRNRTLDMMVLVEDAIGAGWLYSLYVTLTGGGEVFFEARGADHVRLVGALVRDAARGGANDAIRALLDLGAADGDVIRDGVEVDVPTSEGAGRRPGAGPSRREGARRRRRPGGPFRGGRVDGDRGVLPVDKTAGSAVVGASITTGTLRVEATKVGADSALAQIVALVQQAQNPKALGRVADWAAFWLVLVAIIEEGSRARGLRPSWSARRSRR